MKRSMTWATRRQGRFVAHRDAQGLGQAVAGHLPHDQPIGQQRRIAGFGLVRRWQSAPARNWQKVPVGGKPAAFNRSGQPIAQAFIAFSDSDRVICAASPSAASATSSCVFDRLNGPRKRFRTAITCAEAIAPANAQPPQPVQALEKVRVHDNILRASTIGGAAVHNPRHIRS